jgi:hypothetical protein
MYNATNDRTAAMSYAISGATTVAASTAWALSISSAVAAGNPFMGASRFNLVTGLTAGSNTFTAKYQSDSGGTANFSNRTISVIDMGS